ncbi:MAG: TIGR02450 family Trp-rich protein [Phormidesmis priestleyi]|uniref:TIGR02450 family Trp-rich protein n=1 Tax=Phormidesmis priestleyi TaxID=268141 RepID=A0A2W4XP75_9CYAN|nr:MAG: TIGR02450 family Trp-rich protein [Phormidesmis priestleyi]
MPKQTLPHLLGSKWTAQQKTLGWRHFQVVNRKKQGKWVFAELVATCDPNVRFWLNAKTLKNRSLWASGWQTLSEINSQSDSQLDPQPFPSQIPSNYIEIKSSY